jgi:hypothetical protein
VKRRILVWLGDSLVYYREPLRDHHARRLCSPAWRLSFLSSAGKPQPFQALSSLGVEAVQWRHIIGRFPGGFRPVFRNAPCWLCTKLPQQAAPAAMRDIKMLLLLPPWLSKGSEQRLQPRIARARRGRLRPQRATPHTAWRCPKASLLN